MFNLVAPRPPGSNFSPSGSHASHSMSSSSDGSGPENAAVASEPTTRQKHRTPRRRATTMLGDAHGESHEGVEMSQVAVGASPSSHDRRRHSNDPEGSSSPSASSSDIDFTNEGGMDGEHPYDGSGLGDDTDRFPPSANGCAGIPPMLESCAARVYADTAARCDSLLSQTRPFFSVPPRFSQLGAFTNEVHAAAGTVALLREDLEVYDQDVFAFCQRYTSTHQHEHSMLAKTFAKQEQDRIARISTFRKRWYVLLNNPKSNWTGRLVTAAEGLLVLISIVAVLIESTPQYNGDVSERYADTWITVEAILTGFFFPLTIFRFFVTPSWTKLFKNPLTWCDILSLLPLFVQLMVNRRSFGFLKTLRMFRLVKLLRMINFIDALAETLVRIATSLVAPFALLGAFVLVLGNILFAVEGGSLVTNRTVGEMASQWNVPLPSMSALLNMTVQEDCWCMSTAAGIYSNRTCLPKESKFVSALQGMWYITASFTSTGYGDIVPLCVAGKLVTGAGLFFSNIFLAMPIAIVGASFAQTVVDHRQRHLQHKRQKASAIRAIRVDQAKSDQLELRLKEERRARLKRGGRGGGGRSNGGQSMSDRIVAAVLRRQQQAEEDGDWDVVDSAEEGIGATTSGADAAARGGGTSTGGMETGTLAAHRRALRDVSATVTSAAEGLFLYLSTELRTQHLAFRLTQQTTKEAEESASAIRQQERWNNNLRSQQDRRQQDDLTSMGSSGTFSDPTGGVGAGGGVARSVALRSVVRNVGSNRALLRYDAVTAADEYLRWLFEYWLLDWLEKSSVGPADAANPFASTIKIDDVDSHNNNNSKRNRKQQQQQQQQRERGVLSDRDIKRDERLNAIRRARLSLRSYLLTTYGSIHPTMLLRAVSRRVGWAAEVTLPTVSRTYLVCNPPPISSKTASVSSPDRDASAAAASSCALSALLPQTVNVWPDEMASIKPLSSPPLHSRDDHQDAVRYPYPTGLLGVLQVSETFCSRQVLFCPNAAHVDRIRINGTPLLEVVVQRLLVAQQQQTMHVADPSSSHRGGVGADDPLDVDDAALLHQQRVTAVELLHTLRYFLNTVGKQLDATFQHGVDSSRAVSDGVQSMFPSLLDGCLATPTRRLPDGGCTSSFVDRLCGVALAPDDVLQFTLLTTAEAANLGLESGKVDVGFVVRLQPFQSTGASAI